MTLTLYNCYNENEIDNIFCWAPSNKQWWITGFNRDFMDVDISKTAMIGKVDFTGQQEMFDSLMAEVNSDENKKNFMIIDEENNTAWVIWWEK